MNQNQNPKTVKINVGKKDGITVAPDIENSRYIVELPNSYDIYWGFNGKTNSQNFATRLESDDPKKVLFAIPLDNLATPEQARNFNIKVNEARKTASEINEESRTFQEALSFDCAKDNKTVAFVFKNPSTKFCIGEVLKTGKYFVALSGGENDDKVFVRVLRTSRFLSGKDEFSNREEAIQKVFPLESTKYLRFDDHGKITVKDYAPRAKVEQKPIQAAPEATGPIQDAPKPDQVAPQDQAKPIVAEAAKPAPQETVVEKPIALEVPKPAQVAPQPQAMPVVAESVKPAPQEVKPAVIDAEKPKAQEATAQEKAKSSKTPPKKEPKPGEMDAEKVAKEMAEKIAPKEKTQTKAAAKVQK